MAKEFARFKRSADSLIIYKSGFAYEVFIQIIRWAFTLFVPIWFAWSAVNHQIKPVWEFDLNLLCVLFTALIGFTFYSTRRKFRKYHPFTLQKLADGYSINGKFDVTGVFDQFFVIHFFNTLGTGSLSYEIYSVKEKRKYLVADQLSKPEFDFYLNELKSFTGIDSVFVKERSGFSFPLFYRY